MNPFLYLSIGKVCRCKYPLCLGMAVNRNQCRLERDATRWSEIGSCSSLGDICEIKWIGLCFPTDVEHSICKQFRFCILVNIVPAVRRLIVFHIGCRRGNHELARQWRMTGE